MNLLERLNPARLGDSIKAAAKETRLPFSRWGAGNYPMQGGSYGFGSTYVLPHFDQELNPNSNIVDPLQNSAVAAVVDRVAHALSDAPPILEVREKTGWERVEGHPIISLLHAPNGYHSMMDILGLTAAYQLTCGNAFWKLERYLATKEPYEIWVEPPHNLRIVPDTEEFIAGYEIQVESGQWRPVENDRIVHFRYSLDPLNTRMGWSPLQAGHKQMAGDNRVATYHGALLENCATMSLLIGLREQEGQVPPTPDQMTAIKESIIRDTTGRGAGSISAVNMPVDVHKMAYSPDEMALDKLIAYYETRICALLGVDPMVAGLGSGTEHRTYANMSEAINDFWERRIIPLQARLGAAIQAQMFPLFGLDPAQFRINWDRSGVAALQENEDQKFKRYVEAYKFGVLDRDEGRVKLGYESKPEYIGVFAAPAPGNQTDGEDGAPMNQNDKPKSTKAVEKRPDPHGMRFTKEEKAALLSFDSEAAVALAFATASPAKKELLGAEQPEEKRDGE